MKKIFITCMIPIFVFAKVHYAKIEPYARDRIKSSTNGLVSDVTIKDEGTFVSQKKSYK